MKVVIGTTYTRLKNFSYSQLTLLNRLFSIRTKAPWFSKAYRRRRWDGRERFFNKKTKSFPTGLFKHFEKIAKFKNWEFDPENLNILKPTDIPLRVPPGLKLRPYQKKAAKRALKRKRGILGLATNAGKTIIAAAMIYSLLPRKVIFVVEKKDLLYQTKGVFNKYLKNVSVGIVGDGKKEIDEDIVIATVQTFIRMIGDNPSLGKKWQVLFLDECHHASSKTWYTCAMSIKSEFRYAMSGTPFEKDKVKDFRIISVAGPLIMRVTNDYLIQHGYSAVPTVYFYKVKTTQTLVGTNYSKVYSDGIDQNIYRNRAIVNLATRLAKKGHKILILVIKINHAKFLFNELRQKNDHVFLNFGGTSGYDRRKNQEDFQSSKEGAILVASTIYDEGVDIPEIDCMIMGGGQKKPRKILQKVGRGLRAKKGENKTRIYDFFDLEHKYLSNHSFQRLNVYKGEGFRVVGLTEEARSLIDKNDATRKIVTKARKRTKPRSSQKTQKSSEPRKPPSVKRRQPKRVFVPRLHR